MDYQFSFEKLTVWQDARLYVKFIYKLTSSFPKDELFAMTSQLRRAAVSITSNIAEGTSRISLKEQIRFMEIAYGSALETYCQLISAYDLHFITQEQLQEAKDYIYKISNKLNALQKTQKIRCS